jgi:hypothetical protein
MQKFGKQLRSSINSVLMSHYQVKSTILLRIFVCVICLKLWEQIYLFHNSKHGHYDVKLFYNVTGSGALLLLFNVNIECRTIIF